MNDNNPDCTSLVDQLSTYNIYEPIRVVYRGDNVEQSITGLYWCFAEKADLNSMQWITDAFAMFTEPREDGRRKIAHGETVKIILFSDLVSHSRPAEPIDKSLYICQDSFLPK